MGSEEREGGEDGKGEKCLVSLPLQQWREGGRRETSRGRGRGRQRAMSVDSGVWKAGQRRRLCSVVDRMCKALSGDVYLFSALR